MNRRVVACWLLAVAAFGGMWSAVAVGHSVFQGVFLVLFIGFAFAGGCFLWET